MIQDGGTFFSGYGGSYFWWPDLVSAEIPITLYACPVPHLWLVPVFSKVLQYWFAEQQWRLPLQAGAGVQRLTVILAYVSVICLCMHEQEYSSVGILGKHRAKLMTDPILLKSTNSWQGWNWCSISTLKRGKAETPGNRLDVWALLILAFLGAWKNGRGRKIAPWDGRSEHYQFAREDHLKGVNGRTTWKWK